MSCRIPRKSQSFPKIFRMRILSKIAKRPSDNFSVFIGAEFWEGDVQKSSILRVQQFTDWRDLFEMPFP